MTESDQQKEGAGMACLVFPAGRRPDAAAIARLAATSGAFAVSHDASADGWVELLRDGLTFDLAGLAPGEPAALAPMPRRYGLPAQPPVRALRETIVLRAGPHLAGAERLLPVVRTVAGLAMALTALADVEAVGWLPSESLCDPEWFRAGVTAWLDGGPFPSLALAGLDRAEDGLLHSHGLAFLVGQEFALASGRDGSPGDDGRTAMRLADWLVAHGRVDAGREIVLEGIGAVWLEPVRSGLIRAWRM